jgi:hypothetical protein
MVTTEINRFPASAKARIWDDFKRFLNQCPYTEASANGEAND